MTHSPMKVPRGIVAVRGEPTSNSEVKSVIEELNEAFKKFKSDHNKNLEEVRSETRTVLAGLDDANTKIAAMQMGGGGRGAGAADAGVDTSTRIRAMRKPADFAAHYKGPHANSGERVTVADFMRGIAGMGVNDSVRAALSIGTNSAGGYAVPDVVMPAILGALAPASSLMQAGAGFVPLDTGAKTATTAVIDELPQAAWRSENGGVSVSDPVFRGVVATPRSLACVVKISRELLADGADMDRAIRFAIGQAFAKEIDRVGLRGSGTAPEPRGILNTSGVNIVTSGANGAAPTNYAPILEAVGQILGNDGPMPTAAIMAPRSLVGFAGLKDTTNQPMLKPQLIEPINFISTSQIPTDLEVGTSDDCSEIYVGDFSGMYYLLRENLSIQLLTEAYAGTGQLGFLCHLRADVVIPYPKAFGVITGIRG